MKNIDKKLLKEIPIFESFFNQFGLKRVDGAIYGLLVLSESPLNASNIEKILNLSQSAVCQSLKILKHYGAVESYDVKKKERRCQMHTAREDSLKIVATIFKKRDQQMIEDFQQMADNVLTYDRNRGKSPDSPRMRRMNSIVATSKVANTMIDFIIQLSQSPLPREYSVITKRFSKLLGLITQGIGPLSTLAGLKKNLSRQWIFPEDRRNG